MTIPPPRSPLVPPPFRPRCLVTGVGSVPHDSVEEALSFVHRTAGLFPYWPQMPVKWTGEMMVPQVLESLTLIRAPEPGRPPWRLRSGVKPDDLACAPAELSPRHAEGFFRFLDWLSAHPTMGVLALRGQMAGPSTAEIFVYSSKDLPLSPEFRFALAGWLGRLAAWQVRRLRERLERPVLLTLDEPVLPSGEANREARVELLREAMVPLQEIGGLAGVHSCQNGDWSLVLEAGADAISFDTSLSLRSLLERTELLRDYLNRGGLFGLGLIPTDGSGKPEELARDLWGQLQRHLEGPEEQLRFLEQAYITPACGLGHSHVVVAERVMLQCARAAEELRRLAQRVL